MDEGRQLQVRVGGGLIFNDGDLIEAAALDEQAIAYLWEDQVVAHPAEGRLVRLPDAWCQRPEDMALLVGHSAPVTTGFLAWQRTYLDLFEAANLAANWSDPEVATAAVLARMQDYLPNDDLAFLAELSVVPNAQRLGRL